jgi:hypothetical protein
MQALVAVLLVVPMLLDGLARLGVPQVALEHPQWERSDPSSTRTVEQAPWATFLDRYRSVGPDGVARLAYGSVTPQDRAGLDAHIAALSRVETARLAPPEQRAYWINLYNAATVAVVLDAYPIDSIRDIGGLFSAGPWDRVVAEVEGRPLTLNQIEHGILRAVHPDPRIHYALNCAAVSCPNLAAEPWRAADLDARLEEAERAYVNDPRGVRLEGDRLVLSSIWVWFREDFAQDEAGVLARLAPLAEGRAAAALEARTEADAHAYNWALNDAR